MFCVFPAGALLLIVAGLSHLSAPWLVCWSTHSFITILLPWCYYQLIVDLLVGCQLAQLRPAGPRRCYTPLRVRVEWHRSDTSIRATRTYLNPPPPNRLFVCTKFEVTLQVAIASTYAEFQELYADFKREKFRQQVAAANEQLSDLFHFCCADSESRTAKALRSILEHATTS